MTTDAITTVANQKIVTTHRLDREEPFLQLNQVSQRAAMNDIKKYGTFKMFLYLTKNINEYTFALSKVACKSWGIKESEYRAGVKELEEKGYLIQRPNSNICDFYEYPKIQNPQFRQHRNNEALDDLTSCISL